MLDVHMAIRMEQQLLMENDFLQGVVKQFYIEKEYIRNLMRHVCYIVPNLLNFNLLINVIPFFRQIHTHTHTTTPILAIYDGFLTLVPS